MTVTIALATGCTQTSSGSRATLYESIDALAADSAAIVVGTVSGQTDDGDTTISTIEVINAPDNPTLGQNLTQQNSPVSVGDTVEVRQMTAPLLTVDDEYLLFLTPTELSGDAADQYFVTGADAGIYVRDGDEFRRVATDSGDTLPDVISIAGTASE
ncbi:hypothetical protein [Microbacterium sp. C7(2022)]|uniref:hypothetical protein n=1 Tax=Microbacterium sp. C7(2022) TaxID=2992759 RepID=UPI00237B99F9|nr:hypothetical protein [Microbacterium sp. C7(2022)]